MLQKYLIKRISFLLFFFIIIPIAILWIVQIRNIVDLALENNVSLWAFFRLSAYIVPPLLPHLVPLAFILTSIYVLYNLYKDNEFVILWASGHRPYEIAKPFLKISVWLFLLMLITNFWIAPNSKQRLKQETYNIKQDLIQSLLQPQIFQYPSKGITIYIQDIIHNSQMKGFFIEDKTDEKLYKSFIASEAYFIDNEEGTSQLLLLNGKINLIPTDKSNKSSIVQFERFALNIDMLSDKSKQDFTLKIKDYDIIELIKRWKNKNQQNEIIEHIHKLFISSITPIIMILIFIVGFIRPLQPRNFKIRRVFSVLGYASCLKIIESYLSDLGGNNIYIFYLISIIIIAYSLYYFSKTGSAYEN